MTYHNKWFLSTNDEYFVFEQPYDTVDDAKLWANSYCKQHDIDVCYIGRACRIEFKDIFTTMHVEQLIENLNEDDKLMAAEEDVIEITTMQTEQLHKLMLKWMETYLNKITYHNMEDVEIYESTRQSNTTERHTDT